MNFEIFHQIRLENTFGDRLDPLDPIIVDLMYEETPEGLRSLSRRRFLQLATSAGAALLAARAKALIDAPSPLVGEGTKLSRINRPTVLPTITPWGTPWKRTGESRPVMPTVYYHELAPSIELQSLLDANPGSHSERVQMLEGIDWDHIDWGAKRNHWDPIPLAGISQATGEMWAIGFNPIEIVSGQTFQVPQRACPDDHAGNYHPDFTGQVLEVWNNGACGTAGWPNCGYDLESRYVYAHQAFCIK